MMTLSDKINAALAFWSFVLSVISVIAVWISIHQNNKMLESSTRPYVGIRCEAIVMPKEVARYVVIQNFGQTSAHILEITCKGDVSSEFLARIKLIKGTTLSPRQRIMYYIGPSNAQKEEKASFTVEYETPEEKKYSEKIDVNLIVGTSAMRSKDEFATAFALQDILARLL